MNRVSRTDEPFEGDGYNQSPNPLSNDLTTNQDLNGIANARELGREDPRSMRGAQPPGADEDGSSAKAAGDKNVFPPPSASIHYDAGQTSGKGGFQVNPSSPLPPPSPPIAPHDDGLGNGFNHGFNHGSITSSPRRLYRSPGQRLKSALFKFSSFIGPGFMIAVAYSKYHVSSTPTKSIHTSSPVTNIPSPSRSRKLCYGHCRWCLIPLPATVYRPLGQRLRHLPPESCHQAWNCQWTQSRRGLSGFSATVA